MDNRRRGVYLQDMSSLPPARFLDHATQPHIATLVMMAGLATLPMNIFLPSLPNISVYFDTPYSVLQLSVAIFLASSAVMQIVVGPLSDRFGRRPVILAGLMVYILGTLGAIFAPNAETFLVTRVLQASVVVGLALGRAVIRDMVPQDQAASMIGYVTMGMAILPTLGPAMGGLLDEAFGWQSVFWLQVGLGLGVLLLVWADLGETAEARPTSFAAQVRDYPELFASPRFWGYCLAAGFGSGGFFAYLGGGPFVGSEIYGLSPAMLGCQCRSKIPQKCRSNFPHFRDLVTSQIRGLS
jgi:DHA1 family bicyclomycin/chloramphenicol resistance-like MFS transporter